MSESAWARTWSVAKGALIAGAGAALTYLSVAAGAIDFGPATPALTACFALLIQAARQALAQWAASREAAAPAQGEEQEGP